MSFRLPIQQFETPTEQPLVESRITGGMISNSDPADIPNGAATLSVNSRTYADYTFRAPGLSDSNLQLFLAQENGDALLTEAYDFILVEFPPINSPVLLFTQYIRYDGTVVYLRFTKDSIAKVAAGVWTGLSGTLTGANTDRFRIVTTADANQDYFIFTNNGADPIKYLNSTATSYSNLGNAPRYRYVCVFFNRVIGANLVGASPKPDLIGWSGDYNFTEWDPTVDISAGNTPLTEAQSDYADPIAGLFGFATVMLILRERSLWIATKRDVASNPFSFQAAFPSVGCDTPNSATQTRNGIVWYDYRSNQIYWYEVGSTPKPIGDPIRDILRSSITNKNTVHGSYDVPNSTYRLTVPGSSTTNSRVFLFNFDTNSWSYDEYNNAYGIYPVDGGIVRLSYDQLTGTYDQITGTYDNYGLTDATPPINYIGYADGSLAYEDASLDGEEFVWRSKVFRLPSGDQIISRLMVLFEPIRAGSFTLNYSKNGGPWTTYKTVTFNGVQGRTRTYSTKLIRANEYQWELRCSSGNIKLYEFKIDMSASQEDK